MHRERSKGVSRFLPNEKNKFGKQLKNTKDLTSIMIQDNTMTLVRTKIPNAEMLLFDLLNFIIESAALYAVHIYDVCI